MYDFVRGTLVALRDDTAVVEVGGIGYSLRIPTSTAAVLADGDGEAPCRLFTVCRVREERMLLYGFATEQERAIFERLCTVVGVGPGIGLAVLSGIPIEEFREAVLTGQPRLLQRVKGVGRKTAERLVLELKDVLGREHVASPVGRPATSTSGGSATPRSATDAVRALEVLGFALHEAENAVRGVLADQPEATTEELVRLATRR